MVSSLGCPLDIYAAFLSQFCRRLPVSCSHADVAGRPPSSGGGTRSSARLAHNAFSGPERREPTKREHGPVGLPTQQPRQRHRQAIQAGDDRSNAGSESKAAACALRGGAH